MHQAVLSFEYLSAERARRIERSLMPEVGDIDDDRSSLTMDRDGTVLELVIVADDHVALRAGLNTWCSLVSVAEATGDIESG